MAPDSAVPAGATACTVPLTVRSGRASKTASTVWPGTIAAASNSVNGTTADRAPERASTMNWLPPGRATELLPWVVVPGIAASEPGARALVPVLAVRYSPTAPLIAVTVPSNGATRVAFARFDFATSTRACALATAACCWAMACGRSDAAEFRLFCAVTTLWFAVWTDVLPAAASTFAFCFVVATAVFAVSRPCLADASAASACVTAAHGGAVHAFWAFSSASSAESLASWAVCWATWARSMATWSACAVASTWPCAALAICRAWSSVL